MPLDKTLALAVIALLLVTVFSLLQSIGILNFHGITGMFVGYGSIRPEKWWNDTWSYRTCVEINSSARNRTNWPVEMDFNFSDLMPSGEFDENSARVIEYLTDNSTEEVLSQFEKANNYDSAGNAFGTVVFMLNGTLNVNENRTFCVYYDKKGHYDKSFPNYENMTYSYEAGEINVNTTSLRIYIDEKRGDNLSGIYNVVRVSDGTGIVETGGAERPAEYLEYWNSSDNMSFELDNVLIFKGPVRVTIRLNGTETLIGGNATNKTYVEKYYYIYNRSGTEERGGFLKTRTLIKNIHNSNITISSPNAGISALDLDRTFPTVLDHSLTAVNNSNPRSYARAAAEYENFFAAIINMNQTGNFYADNQTLMFGRIGITLGETNLTPNQSVSEDSLVYFGAFDDPGSEFQNILMSARNPESIFINGPERVHALNTPYINATIYNRNETMLIRLNITSDPYNLTKYVNATLSNGTASGSDDITIELYDDGTHGDLQAGDKNFTNTHHFQTDAPTGEWEINFTIYDNDYVIVDTNSTKFNITDIFSTNLTIINDKPILGTVVFADFTVRNYGNNSYIKGAQINCSANSTPEIIVTNITDLNNGTYKLNFTAPVDIGKYGLFCNATKDGNKGNFTTNFETESSNTTLNVTAEPAEASLSNITMSQNQSFGLNITINNTGNGTAYNSVIYFNLSANWSTQPQNQSCGNLDKQTGCFRSFNITAPANATPAAYNVTPIVNWTNPDSTNKTSWATVNATVSQNPVLNAVESSIKKEAKDGLEMIIGNFTVESLGNYNLTNINFSCYSGEACQNFSVEFYPSNISSLPNGAAQQVIVNITVPQYYAYGEYNGTVNVSSGNDGYELLILNITVPAKTIINSTANATNYTANNVSLQGNETFSFSLNSTNMGNGSARNISIWLQFPQNWLAQPQNETCPDEKSGENCSRSFNITIIKNTTPGTYRINITSNWTNPDATLNSSTSYIDAIVSQNPIINVTESDIAGTVSGGNSTNVANFTVWSVGNYNVNGVSFNCTSGVVCQNFTVSFYPANITSLANGLNQTVKINVTVPTETGAGTYNGTINISAANDGSDSLVLNVTVPPIRAWNMTPQACNHSESGGIGTVCFVNISNKGNAQLSFNITPSEANQTSVNETSFSIQPKSSKLIEVRFDMNGTEERPLNTTYIVDALEPDTSPDKINLSIMLIPTIEPTISADVVPEIISGEGFVEIYAYAVDHSSTGISWVRANITLPGGNITNLNLNILSGNQWYVRYPQIGNTSTRGVYNVTIYAMDNIGNLGNITTSFKVRAYLNLSSSTLSTRYYQGDTATILYSLSDMNGTGLNNANVSFVVKNSQSNILHLANYTTVFDGKIYPLPTFLIPSDATTGNYSLETNTSYFDQISNETINDTDMRAFSVAQRTVTVTGLFVDITTAVVWYPDNTMKFTIIVYNGEGRPIDPDTLNLTIFDPADNVYFAVNLTNMQRNATGYYIYRYAMPTNTPTGMFIAIADASDGDFSTKSAQAFRVAKGGPYDVRIFPLETEVKQGEWLDFNMIIENKGEVTQDVFLQYWVYSPSLNNTYYSASEAVLTPSHSNQTFTRRGAIYYDQPPGLYYIILKMTYDSVQAPIYSNSTFVVTKSASNITYYVDVPVSSPPITGGSIFEQVTRNETLPGIMIEKYNSNIKVARGYTKMESVVVRNSGKTVISNISVYMDDIPSDWYVVAPANYAFLAPGDATNFVITLTFPRNADIKYYNATIYAQSFLLTDSKHIRIEVFQSMEEMLDSEIKAAKSLLVELLLNMSEAERQGKDTSSPALLIPQINSLIGDAEDGLNSGNLEHSMKKISEAKVLLERAIDMLNDAPLRKRAFELPIWAWLFVILIAMGGVFAYMTLVKNKSGVRPYVTLLGKVAEAVKGRPKDVRALSEEREKLVNVLSALEKQKSEGLISPQAYRNMKTEFESKLEKIKKQMR